MNAETAQQQIEAIKRVTEEALKSKESALKLLVDAGIVKEEKKPKETTRKSRL